MSGGNCPRNEAVSANSKPGPNPQSGLLVFTGFELDVPAAGDAIGLVDAPSRLLEVVALREVDALGEAFGDFRWCSTKDGLGELRAEEDVVAVVLGERSSQAFEEVVAE